MSSSVNVTVVRQVFTRQPGQKGPLWRGAIKFSVGDHDLITTDAVLWEGGEKGHFLVGPDSARVTRNASGEYTATVPTGQNGRPFQSVRFGDSFADVAIPVILATIAGDLTDEAEDAFSDMG